jgi:hypothetical protein
MFKRIDYIWCVFFAATALLTRIPLLEKFQSHWDGPDYSIAIVRYSLLQFTPSPPGYPLYIGLGKLFYLIVHDPHLAILCISVLGSVIGAVVFYVVGSKLYNRSVGVVATSLFLSGSSFYYFSLTPYAYGLLPSLMTLLAYSVYRIYILKKNEGIFLGVIFSISFGIRPQEIIQNGPLFCLGFYFLSVREKVKCCITFLIITLLWLIPLLHSIGGLKNYIDFSRSFAHTAFSYVPITQHVELMMKGFLLSFGISCFFLFYYLWQIIFHKNIKKYITQIIFYGFWIMPGFLFNLFIRTEHAGYQMSYLSAFILVISLAVYSSTKKYKFIFIGVLTSIILFNLVWFFYNRDPNYIKPYRPTSFHYSDIQKNDLKTGSKITFIKSHFKPDTTLIITLEVLWSPYRYHLKNYALTELSGLDILTPSYAHVRRDTKYWNLIVSTDNNMEVIVPSDITTIVFPDDSMSSWVKNIPVKTYQLPGKSILTVISVKPGDTLQYGYHKITKLR